MDVHTPAQRSYNMSRIRGKNTRPEIIVRKGLWAAGFRYRLHTKNLPGKPDIVLHKYNAVIFVHGCYWHRHGCNATVTPATNRDKWLKKFSENVNRDKRNQEKLLEKGWRIAVVWECALNEQCINNTISALSEWINAGPTFIEIPN